MQRRPAGDRIINHKNATLTMPEDRARIEIIAREPRVKYTKQSQVTASNNSSDKNKLN